MSTFSTASHINNHYIFKFETRTSYTETDCGVRKCDFETSYNTRKAIIIIHRFLFRPRWEPSYEGKKRRYFLKKYCPRSGRHQGRSYDHDDHPRRRFSIGKAYGHKEWNMRLRKVRKLCIKAKSFIRGHTVSDGSFLTIHGKRRRFRRERFCHFIK